MITSFEELLKKCPKSILNKLEDLKDLKERKDYHPEGNTYEHIRIVTTRLIQTGDIDLILAGLFHDICKLDAAILKHQNIYYSDKKRFEQMKKDADLKTYGHDVLGSQLIDKQYVDFIKSMGGNPERVSLIVRQHMKAKQMDDMRPEKRKQFESSPVYKDLLIFKQADNMLKPFNYEKEQ